MTILDPIKIKGPEVPEPSKELQELHDRLEKYNFDLIYMPKVELFDINNVKFMSPIKLSEATSFLSREVRWHDRDLLSKLTVDESMNNLYGQWILFENSLPPKLINMPEGIKQEAYVNEPFSDFILERTEWKRNNDLRSSTQFAENSRVGLSLSELILKIPQFEEELGLAEKELRFPTMAEYVVSNLYYPQLSDMEIFEVTSTKVDNGKQHIHVVKNSSVHWRERMEKDCDDIFSLRFDTPIDMGGASYGMGFRFVVDPSKKFPMIHGGWHDVLIDNIGFDETPWDE